MNKGNFEKLPETKKRIIEKAYFAAYNHEITASDFFSVCRQALEEDEFNALFMDAEADERAKRQEEIKSDHIDDIMQYAGVDLREEDENIARDTEYAQSYEQQDMREDRNSKIESLFNTGQFHEFIGRVVAQKQMKITNEGVYLIYQFVRRKLMDLMDRLEAAANQRVEGGLIGMNFKIENEVSKQLWYLNEAEKVLEDRLMLKKEEETKKKQISEREDLAIKKRQSSNVAMAAMGIEQKSWMVGGGLKSTEEASKFTPVYAPFDEKGLEGKMKGKMITMKDFVYVLERDRRYNKSLFLVQYYFKAS